jgi:hypothetical protein
LPRFLEPSSVLQWAPPLSRSSGNFRISKYTFRFLVSICPTGDTGLGIPHTQTRHRKAPSLGFTFPCVMTSLQQFFAFNINTCPFRTFVRESSSLKNSWHHSDTYPLRPRPRHRVSSNQLRRHPHKQPPCSGRHPRGRASNNECLWVVGCSWSRQLHLSRKQCNYRFIHDTSREREWNVRA